MLSVCRSCGGRELEPVLDLGDVPLVNALVEPSTATPDRRYPLAVVRCSVCTLVQITETVSPEVLFRDYTYFSSYSQTLLDHARAFAAEAIRHLHLGPDSFVVEAASNDGYLLQYFAQAGVPSLGIEPAQNIAAVARDRGIDSIAEFLDEDLAQRIVADHGAADLVVANNVLAHVPDLHRFIAALRTLVGERGSLVVEVPYLCDLVDRLEFDTIYHEHVYYFTLTSLAAAFRQHELELAGVERLPVHGGSLRIRAAAAAEPDDSVERLLFEEQRWGIRDRDRFDRFAASVDHLRRELRDYVSALVWDGAAVAAYGAAAKGVVLANVCGLDTQLVRFVVDRNPHKQGKLFPGVRIPIVEPDALAREGPDYCLLFAWNLADEIVGQQTSYRKRGGKFIFPLPTPAIVDS